jgi:hypothetical protein
MSESTTDALLGHGMPAQLAEHIGANYSLVNGKGTTQVGAATILTKNAELNPSGGNTAFILPGVGNVNEKYGVVNEQATTAVVFVPVGHYLNGTQNGSLNVAQNGAAIIWQYKPNYWASK